MQDRSKTAKWYATFLLVCVVWQGMVIIGVKSMRSNAPSIVAAPKPQATPTTPTVIYVAGAQAIGK